MKSRTYRLAPRDRTGWFLGLQAPQVLCAGGGLLAASVLASHGAPVAVVAAPVLLGTALAFARFGGEALVDVGPVGVAAGARRLLGHHRWFAPGRLPVAQAPPLPPALADQRILAVPAGPARCWSGEEVGVVHDRRTGAWAATLRVAGRGFCLLDPPDQERLCALWGDALGSCCREVGPLRALRVAVRCAPVELSDRTLGPLGVTGRDTLLTLVVGGARGQRGQVDATEALLSETALFAQRLDAAGLGATVLSPGEPGAALRVRFDPPAEDLRARSLGERAGLVGVVDAGPLAVEERWSEVRVDGCYHRAFCVAEWPRLELPPAWLSGLLLHEGVTFTLAVWLEPIPVRRSRRAVERQAAKLTSDEEQRTRAGFRVGADHHRQAQALEEREAELVAGHPELEYAGVVVVSATEPDALGRAASELCQVAAACGIELRPLQGRHLAALGATLPLARGLAGSRR